LVFTTRTFKRIPSHTTIRSRCKQERYGIPRPKLRKECVQKIFTRCKAAEDELADKVRGGFCKTKARMGVTFSWQFALPRWNTRQNFVKCSKTDKTTCPCLFRDPDRLLSSQWIWGDGHFF